MALHGLRSGISAISDDDGGGLVPLIQELSFARSLDEVMAVTRTGARRLLGCDGVTFVLRDGDLCHYADEDAISPLWKGQRFPLTACISGWAMLNRATAAIEDIYADPRIPHDAYRLTFVKSLAMVPVRREDPIAAIGAYWASRHRPDQREIRVLEAIANSAALAIANAELVRSLEAARAEAELLSEQKTRFLAACSHDLRQPFQAMRLFMAALAGTAAPSQQPLLDKLDQAMAMGEDVLAALRDVSTLETGWIKAEPVVFALDTVMERLRLTCEEAARCKGLELEVRPAPFTVRSDPALVGRILSNLALNAVKFTERGRVLVRARRRGACVAVQVWDSGIGMPGEALTRIFEDFVQLGDPARNSAGGLGLGLGIVRRLAGLLGCRVRVASRPGRGSVFTVLLPAG